MDYQLPKPHFGEKRVCFHCLQTSEFKTKIVILRNHRGFLCEPCVIDSVSANVKAAYRKYLMGVQSQQPFIGDLVVSILEITASGFRGFDLEYWKILRERSEYNHLRTQSVSMALELLAENEILNADYALGAYPIYFESGALSKDRYRKPA